MEKHLIKPAYERALFLLFVFGGVLNLVYEAIIIHHYETNGGQVSVLYKALLLFATIQMYWNLYYITTADNRIKTNGSKNMTLCEKCISLANPMRHYCHQCNSCINKKDHHCWFAGNCIGQENQRNFVVLSFYLWLVALVENIFNLEYVCGVLGCGIFSLISVCLPHFPIFLQNFHPWTIFTNIMTFLGALLFVLFSILLYYQISRLINGKANRGIGESKPVRYPFNTIVVIQNITYVMGDRWYLPFLCPLFNCDAKIHTD